MSAIYRLPSVVALLALAGIVAGTRAAAQAAEANYDEAKVPPYTLPDPLVMANGDKVTDAETWRTKRRPEILQLFRTQMFGRSPGRPEGMTWEVTDCDKQALGGKAMRKQVTVYFTGKKDGPSMDLLIYLPNAAAKPVPAFLGLNFQGNHAIHPDPGIKLSKSWMRHNPAQGVVDNRATEATSRRQRPAAGRWRRSWPAATPWPRSTTATSTPISTTASRTASIRCSTPGPDEARPGRMGLDRRLGLGLSRALDYLETDADIDAKHVAVLGHSRLGKTALWAGAEDERFALVISNNSGCGGAALSRRGFGETVARINTSFPHWFCGNFKQYNDNEAKLPIDQHVLIALIAPRPVYVASAEEDRWADPRGEFLSAKHAEPVYRLLGTGGLPADDMPAVDHPVGDIIGYHIRTGKHDVTDYDWEQYLNFADKH